MALGKEESKQTLLTKLRRVLAARFGEEDLRDLCFSLGIDYDDLGGDGAKSKARELVTYCDRRKCIQKLVETALKLRPDVELNDINFPDGTKQLFLQGAVLYANVLGFSNLSPADQSQIIDFVGQEITRFLQVFRPKHWLDFRGGDFLLFLEHERNIRPEDVLTTALVLGLEAQLRIQEMGQHKDFKLGMVLHWEDSAQRHKIGRESYLIGRALDEAQLLMSFSDRGHFFISMNAYRFLKRHLKETRQANLGTLLHALLPNDLANRSNFKMWPRVYQPQQTRGTYTYSGKIFRFHDKHKRPHDLYNLYIEDSNKGVHIGSLSVPYHRVAIEYRDDRKARPQQVFIQKLIEADDVVIIGITHEGTARFLREALEQRRKEGRDFWNQLQVVFPSQSVLKKIVDQHSTRVRQTKWEGGKRSVFQFLMNQGADYLNHWECLEYDGNLPFAGNRFIVNKQNESAYESVRIAPILPGGDMRSTYYVELFNGMPAYDQVSRAFSLICANSSKITEWNLYGQQEEGEFHYYGIVNRRRLNTRKQFCIPVVLVMLHADVEAGHKSILQERTPYNGSSDIGKFSNISGRVTDMDVYKALGLRPQVDFEYNHKDRRDGVATAEFKNRTNLDKSDPLPPGTWEATAVREIQEELGLEITSDRLVPHCTHYLERQDGDLFFKIFSLELRCTPDDELQIIEDSRPHAKLVPFGWNKLEQYHRDRKFNRLLQTKFAPVFVPIFRELGIE